MCFLYENKRLASKEILRCTDYVVPESQYETGLCLICQAWVIRANMTNHRDSWKHLAGFFETLDYTQFDVLPIVIQNLTMSYIYGKAYPVFNIKRIRNIYFKRVDFTKKRVLAWKRKGVQKDQMIKQHRIKKQKLIEEDAMDVDSDE